MTAPHRLMSRPTLVASLVLGLALAGCEGLDPPSAPSADTVQDVAAGAYVAQALRIKQATPLEYDQKIRALREAHGIAAPSTPPANPIDDSLGSKRLDIDRAPFFQRNDAVQLFTREYHAMRPYITTFFLKKGATRQWFTSGGNPGVDPVLVLFQYRDTNFIQTGSIPSSAMPLIDIRGYNDDHTGLHSRINYTAPSDGHYVVLMFPYSESTMGEVTLNSNGCDPPPPPTCTTVNGQTFCRDNPAMCFTNEALAVSVVGVTVRGVSNADIMTSENLSNADPWLFAFNIDQSRGASNDDFNGLNSRIDRGDFRTTSSSIILLAGYSNQGRARFTASSR